MIKHIVSGGQTGADRAALDAAIDLGIACGGWVPKGRLDENGVIPVDYRNLVEAEDSFPETRTELNIRDSDVTLILSHGELHGGSKFTASKARELRKPCLHVDLTLRSVPDALREIGNWLARVHPVVLNVAGPPASDDPHIYAKTKRIVEALLIDDNTSQSSDLLTIALARRDAALANFRHWDQVRWLVPYWFCVLATASGGLVGALARPENMAEIRSAAFGLGIFGILCLVLVFNLGRYHNAALRRYEAFLTQIPVDDLYKEALRADLPFEFTFKNCTIPKTATFWFFFYIIALVVLFLCTAFFGMWWQAV